MDLNKLLTFALKQKASDLHLSSGEPPITRIHGKMKKINCPALSDEQLRKMLFEIMHEKQRREFQERHELDFSTQLGEHGRFRVNVFMQRRGIAAVFRSIPTKILTFDDLNLPPVCKEICDNSRGLVLVTGPTGSGKSTTLAAMIDHINKTKHEHILTIEDPIEFVHECHNSLINQRELGPHTHSFANALKSALREDPDVILVGEMRDLETISLALTAAETGHLVFGTLHTSSAAKTIDRIIDVFPPEQQSQIRAMISESLRAVLSQTLLRRADGKGRIAAIEILIGVPAIRNLVREGKIPQMLSVMQTGAQYGMQTLEAVLKKYMKEGLITEEEAMAKAPNKETFGK